MPQTKQEKLSEQMNRFSNDDIRLLHPYDSKINHEAEMWRKVCGK